MWAVSFIFAENAAPIMETIKEVYKMITFMILTTILAVMAVTAVVLAISGGTAIALMLSDLIVFILIVWFIVWLGNKLHKKGS